MKKLLLLIVLAWYVTSCSSDNKGAQPTYSVTPTEEDLAASSTSESPIENTMEQKGAQLIKSSDCMSCHTMENKLVGPSFKEIAARYSEKDLDMLSEKIIHGGQGNWGEVPMLAHPQVPKQDANAMVEFILSLKK